MESNTKYLIVKSSLSDSELTYELKNTLHLDDVKDGMRHKVIFKINSCDVNITCLDSSEFNGEINITNGWEVVNNQI
jgi:hypothetical protein